MTFETSKRKNGKPSLWFYLVWAAPGAANSVMVILLGYITYFSTNVLGLPPALAGTLLFASKMFDGVTDVIAGFIIDRTNSRFGRARPYDFAGFMFVLFTVILFGIPKMGQSATAVYIFVLYTMIFSVWSTLLTCAGTVYLARAVEDDASRISIGSISGMIASIVTMIAAVFMPQAIAAAGNSRESWFKIAVIMGIPCMIFSMLRFFAIKEISSSRQKKQEDMKVREGIYQLFHNKYIMLFALSLLFANISSNMAQAAPYYFQYIVGDLSLQSLSALGGLAGPFTLILFPALSKRIGLKGVMQLGLACGIMGRLLPLLDLTSMPILIIGSLFCGISLMPIFILASNAVINCMDYGEWKYGKRGEGIYSCVIGFCSKVGTGLAAAIIGGITALGGFDGGLAVQSPLAERAVILLYTVIPAAAFAVSMIILHFYKLDKQLPQIQSELEQRKREENKI